MLTTIKYAAAFRINKYAYARRANYILQEIELVIETRGVLLGHATEEPNGGESICLNLTDHILK